jgi:lipopolysaccharide transport system permease protein
MSVVVNERVSPQVGAATVPRRPAWILSICLDALLGVVAYSAAYWLRFGTERLPAFLPGLLSTMPVVAGAEIVLLVAVGAYAPRPRAIWLSRVIAGGVAGTAAAALFIWAVLGFAGISRMAFVANALLFSIAAIGWRGVWVLRMRAAARAAARASRGDLVDRAEEMTLVTVLTGFYRYRGLLKALVLKDLKLKYRGSVFGFMWSLLNPLLMIVVYTVAFTFILGIRNEMFVFYLMLGQLAWSFFASSAMMSTGSIIDNGGLLRTVLFPRAILPIGTVLFNFAQYLLTVSVFLPAMLIWYQVPLAAPMLAFPVMLALQVVFTIGVALVLATATAFFRDIRHLVEVVLAVVFWLTPIVYELGQVPERLRLLILLSPLSSFVVGYQKLFFFREWPEATVWVVASAYAIGSFVVGATLLLAFEDRFTEQL